MEYLYAVKAMSYAANLETRLRDIEYELWICKMGDEDRKLMLREGMQIEADISEIERTCSWVTN